MRIDAVAGESRERVVEVVPVVAERKQRERREVARLVTSPRAERPGPPQVACRVDGECRLLKEEHAHEPSPQESPDHAGDGAGDRQAEQRREREGYHAEEREETIEDDEIAIGEKVRNPPLAFLGRGTKQPAAMRVECTANLATDGQTGEVRRVRIALHVGVGVVTAMVGRPAENASFERE